MAKNDVPPQIRTKMRIGAGNKRYDQFSFLLSGVILTGLLVWTFTNINALVFLIVVFVSTRKLP